MDTVYSLMVSKCDLLKCVCTVWEDPRTHFSFSCLNVPTLPHFSFNSSISFCSTCSCRHFLLFKVMLKVPSDKVKSQLKWRWCPYLLCSDYYFEYFEDHSIDGFWRFFSWWVMFPCRKDDAGITTEWKTNFHAVLPSLALLKSLCLSIIKWSQTTSKFEIVTTAATFQIT